MKLSLGICTTSLTAVLLTALLSTSGEKETPKAKPVNEEKFHKRLLEIAGKYEQFGRVDDEYRWAPFLCRMPNPGLPRYSESKDEQTHGHKLYSLFSSQREVYLALGLADKGEKQDVPEGIAIVKESWIPEKLDKKPTLDELQPQVRESKDKAGVNVHDAFLPFVEKDDQWYRASKKAGLYVMFKIDPKTEGTDQGWVYATVTADGKTVTSAGAVKSCMECHKEAKHDRLFGLKEAKQ